MSLPLILLQEETARRHLLEALSQEDRDLMQGENPCRKVLPHLGGDLESRKMCQAYDSLPYVGLNCHGQETIVPKIFHSISKDNTENHHQAMISAVNPEYVRNHVGDDEGLEFIREQCGEKYAQVYTCLAPPAFRADLFRFCALYAQGGIYLDSDIVPLVPLDELYSPCSVATVGHDIPQAGSAGKQMKILASAPGAPIFKCMLDRIAENVERNAHPKGALQVSGPSLLQECFEQHHENVAITYHDTREAQWPFTGMRQGETILAYEKPSRKSFGPDDSDYAAFFNEGNLYREQCSLLPRFDYPSVHDRIRQVVGDWYSHRSFDLAELCEKFSALSWPNDEAVSFLNSIPQNEVAWENKKDILLYNHKSDDEMDEASIGSAEEISHTSGMTVDEKLGYKYLLGGNVDSDLAWMLYSSSVVFMPRSATNGYLTKEALVPWYHYIPVKENLSDLRAMIHRARSHDEDARRIAQQATEYVRKMFLSKEADVDMKAVRSGVMELFETQYGASLQQCKSINR